MNDIFINFQMNTGTGGNSIGETAWNLLLKPKLQSKKQKFQSDTLCGHFHIKFFFKLK